ncbi:hypothetical protein [Klebsiella quasipneumoniae]|uniref:hypothetical protein n=1 Tax=Klebsiella quasipneumoniae TaxID=1463165 RepID=UPI0021F9E570|nr:hypothetical protein [Klebsiella quasipneumoniae]BDO01171.1 hypothetical protein KAM622c_07580 [Klebsiella quasipneumoniae subsp. quasipneumoniae]
MAINRLVCQCLALSILGTAAFGVQAETQSFKCVYPKYSDHEGIHNAKNPMAEFRIIDTKTNKFNMTGNVSSVEVTPVPNGVNGNSFIETTPVGNVTVTTVMANGESVHSRSMVYPDGILASQYYGTCATN